MSKRRYFNFYSSRAEQKLVNSLVAETIDMYGLDVFYIKRTVLTPDNVIVDDKFASYTAAYPSRLYLKNMDGFAGDGTFLSKFGLEIRDEVVFTYAVRAFQDDVNANDSSLIRPREGDLIWSSLDNRVYEIKFVDQKARMYQFGAIQSWDLTCEVAEYNNETWSTGYDFLDSIFVKVEADMPYNLPTLLLSEDGLSFITTDDGTPIAWGEVDPSTNDPLGENSGLDYEAQEFINFTEQNPFADGKEY